MPDLEQADDKGTGGELTVNCCVFGIYNKTIRRSENSGVVTGVSNFTHYTATEWNFTIEDSVKLVDLICI